LTTVSVNELLWLIDHDFCYFTAIVGAIGVIWSILWFFLVYNSPATHPRISAEERQYIEKALNKSVQHKVVTSTSSRYIVIVGFAFIRTKRYRIINHVDDQLDLYCDVSITCRILRSSSGDDLVDFLKSGVSVRPSVRLSVHKVFFRFRSNLACA